MDNSKGTEEKEINLLALFFQLWKNRNFILKISFIGFVVGIIIAFSIPKEYSTTVFLAPEVKSSGNKTGGVGALAAMAGINLQIRSEDDISSELYPNILKSTPFIMGILDVKVKDKSTNINTNLYTYLKDMQKAPWWTAILSLPSHILGFFTSSKADTELKEVPFFDKGKINLSGEELRVTEDLKNRINISVDKKNGAITLSTTMQSPVISAFLVDTITAYLQNYIINYRTQKARQDLLFTQKLYDETKEQYYQAQQEYASYSDGNLDIVSDRSRIKKERLQNEMNLAYNIYNQMAQQLQMAKVKVQDTTPVYTMIQPSIIPVIPDKPNKKLIAIGYFFLALSGACIWILTRDFFSNYFNNKR